MLWRNPHSWSPTRRRQLLRRRCAYVRRPGRERSGPEWPRIVPVPEGALRESRSPRPGRRRSWVLGSDPNGTSTCDVRTYGRRHPVPSGYHKRRRRVLRRLLLVTRMELDGAHRDRSTCTPRPNLALVAQANSTKDCGVRVLFLCRS